MPRSPRPDFTESIAHVISRGVDRREIFSNDGDRLIFLRFMREAFRPCGIKVVAYCLMGNHFHLLLSIGHVGLSQPMHRLLLRYAMYFNRRHGRVGHLFQARYKPFRVHSTRRLFHLVDYIHNNPVAAGIVGSPEKWPWSSHEEFVSGVYRRIDLTSLENVAEVTPEELRAAYLHLWETRRSEKTSPPTLNEHLERAADIAGLDVVEVLSGAKGEQAAKARALFVRAASGAGFKAADIARAMKRSEAAVSQLKRKLKLSTCPLA
jgi:putative transposase